MLFDVSICHFKSFGADVVTKVSTLNPLVEGMASADDACITFHYETDMPLHEITA